MTNEQIEKHVKYWLTTAAHDYDTMRALFDSKRYSDSLFYGHIVLEKVLKAHVVSATKNEAPKLHDLVRLQAMAELNLPSETVSFLNKINDFNIRARYPEYKLMIYKLCTRAYTDNYLKKIKSLYKALCLKLKQKK